MSILRPFPTSSSVSSTKVNGELETDDRVEVTTVQGTNFGKVSRFG
jgi:hypothetical protein